MTKKSNYLLSLFGALLLASPIQAQNLLPKPQQVTMGKGVFKTSDGVKVENQVGADAENIYTKAWNAKVNDAAKRVVKFTKLANASSPEAYKLHVAPDAIEISAASSEGFLRAWQTMEQLTTKKGIACCDIVDAPAYKWRGLMLDVSRHYFPISFLKKQIDVMSEYKFNRLHIHLTDAAGWRIEIKRYPRLNSFAAWRSGKLWKDWNANGNKYLDLHIDEELSEVSQGLTWLADHLSRHPFPGHICCSHGCALAAGSDEQAAPILRQLAAHGVTLIALPMTNLLLQDATFGRTPRQRGITLLHEAQAAGVATLLGCDNVQDAFCPAGSYDPLDTLACGLFSAQLSDLFDRQSRLICDRAALTGSPADAAPFAIGAAASVVIFPGSDRFTWPLNSAARLVVNHGRLTHRRVWQEEMAHES